MNTEPKTAQCIELDRIAIYESTQVRAVIDQTIVTEYAAQMMDLTAELFPPVVLFRDASDQIYLADGFHRYYACRKNGFKDILAIVHHGTKQQALLHGLSSNTQHGLRRTNADKRRSVALAIEGWPHFSDRQIATICAVHHEVVSRVRGGQLAENASSNPLEINKTTPETPPKRLGADGKRRKLPVKAAALKLPEAPKVVAEVVPPPVPEAPTAVVEEEIPQSPPVRHTMRHGYAQQISSIATEAIAHATDEQLSSLKLQLAVISLRVAEAIKARQLNK